METAEEFNDTLHAETGSSVHRCSIFEGIDVVLDLFDRDAETLGSLSQHSRVMHSLSSARDLFAAHEEVIRVSVVRINWVNHGVEGSRVDWVSVKHVEVSVVFCLHKRTQCLLCLSR